MQEVHPTTRAGLGIYATTRAEDESWRRPVPEEEVLVALNGNALEACLVALEAHEAAEGADCHCDLHADLRGLAFNLEAGSSLIDGELSINRERLAAVNRVIHQLTLRSPATKHHKEYRLLAILDLIVGAVDAVVDAHDAADPDGDCACTLCDDVFGHQYNVRLARDLIGGQFPAWLDECPPSQEPLAVLLQVALAQPAEAEAVVTTAAVTSVQPMPRAAVPAAVKPTAPSAPRKSRNYWEPSDD